MNIKTNQYDVVIVGSGTCGATIARELSRQNKKVLMLERGGNGPLKESIMGFISMADEVKLGKKMTTLRGITTGGSTGLYFGVVNYPSLDEFQKLGIDLSAELEQVRQELPIAQLPDSLLGEQSICLRDSAIDLGYQWDKNDMLIDLSKVNGGYNYDAKWKAKTFVEQAIDAGATLINKALVNKVIVQDGQAVGVEYVDKSRQFGSKVCQVFGKKIIMAAGELATPKILRDSGVEGIGKDGFFCDPGYAIYGIIPGLEGSNSFVGAMSSPNIDGVELGDANVSHLLLKLMMLGSFKPRHWLNYKQCVGIGVKTEDSKGGQLNQDGRFYKELTKQDHQRLDSGEAQAIKILKNAGAKHIFNVGLTSAGHVGGLISIGEHLDSQLQSNISNLYVCDGSILPENVRITPTVTLVCLAQYLAKQIAVQL